jgi:hypothetical protein
MGKNGKAKRAQAAKTKVLQKFAEAKPVTLSSSNHMINKPCRATSLDCS